MTSFQASASTTAEVRPGAGDLSLASPSDGVGQDDGIDRFGK